ncbi:MAG: hypothetical protein LBP85_01020 [Prevotellaceae bacterium]|jgi:hypothetical protein|nr:hypothetical protein [Prevotellaceae bacterium]
MKKIILSAIFVMATVFGANAQTHKWFIGGELAFWSSKIEAYSLIPEFGAFYANTKVTAFSIAPEIGYNISDRFAVAASLNFSYVKAKAEDNDYYYVEEEKVSGFIINPYLRYTFLKKGIVSAFVDASAAFGISDIKGFEAGIKPGVALALTERFSVVAHFGFAGYNNGKSVGNYAAAGKGFGIDFSGYQSSLGFYYSF